MANISDILSQEQQDCLFSKGGEFSHTLDPKPTLRSAQHLADAIGCETCGLVSVPWPNDPRCPRCDNACMSASRTP
jgi:hypothetical protein